MKTIAFTFKKSSFMFMKLRNFASQSVHDDSLSVTQSSTMRGLLKTFSSEHL